MPSEKSLRTRLKFATRGIATGLRERLAVESRQLPLDVPSLDEVIERVKATAHDEGEAGDERKTFDRALDKLYGPLGSAIAVLRNDPGAELTLGQELALETIVKVDGTRPSTLLRDGRVPDDDPRFGSWREELAPFAASIRRFAAATGRIEPNDGSPSNFFGTGFLVDANGTMLTNWHVLEAMLRRSTTLAEEIGGTFRIYDGVRIEFAGETQSLARRRFKVVAATPSGIDGESFARLDIAVLRIEPWPDSPALPDAIPMVADLDAAQGAVAPVCVIGFPGRPEQVGVADGVDWTTVTNQLVPGGYGLKRLAPGEIAPIIGAVDGDTRPWIIGHDATTFGGSSGSPVMVLRKAAAADANAEAELGYAFGIHFAGSSGTTQRVNYAHALIEDAREQLRKLNVSVKAH